MHANSTSHLAVSPHCDGRSPFAKKAVIAPWSRIANPKISPWGGAFATKFQPFADELAGDAPAYEAPVRPAAVP